MAHFLHLQWHQAHHFPDFPHFRNYFQKDLINFPNLPIVFSYPFFIPYCLSLISIFYFFLFLSFSFILIFHNRSISDAFLVRLVLELFGLFSCFLIINASFAVTFVSLGISRVFISSTFLNWILQEFCICNFLTQMIDTYFFHLLIFLTTIPLISIEDHGNIEKYERICQPYSYTPEISLIHFSYFLFNQAKVSKTSYWD